MSEEVVMYPKTAIAFMMNILFKGLPRRRPYLFANDLLGCVCYRIPYISSDSLTNECMF